MKPAEIRELSDAQLVEKLKEMRAELFNLRFQMASEIAAEKSAVAE